MEILRFTLLGLAIGALYAIAAGWQSAPHVEVRVESSTA